MMENLHTRAKELFAKSLVEGIAPAERPWLDRHLRDCADCAREMATTRDLLGALRNIPIAMPRDLAARTQLRVRLRAQETAPASQSNLLLWLITAMSWLLGLFSAPLVWRGFAWAGNHLRIPKLALEMGFVLWWIVPALIMVGAILYQKAASGSASGSEG
jgi:anti-sigma factor RsiW